MSKTNIQFDINKALEDLKAGKPHWNNKKGVSSDPGLQGLSF